MVLRRCAFLILGVIPAIADEGPLIKEDAGLRGKTAQLPQRGTRNIDGLVEDYSLSRVLVWR